MYSADFTKAHSAKTGVTPVGQHRQASVTIIDYGLGNVRSVANALEALGAEVKISRQPDDLQAADGLILPGVGAFGDGMTNLKALGLIPHLNELVMAQKKPFLGICLGMQLLANSSTEGGQHAGLGWLNAEVTRLNPPLDQPRLKVPHVGWNDVTVTRTCPVLGLPGETKSYYFVHSYALQCHESDMVTGICDYGQEFPAVVQKDNILAVQFHPEKSQKHGLNLLANFLTVIRNNTTGNHTQTASAPNPKRETTC